jgi:hypothetical protein
MGAFPDVLGSAGPIQEAERSPRDKQEGLDNLVNGAASWKFELLRAYIKEAYSQAITFDELAINGRLQAIIDEVDTLKAGVEDESIPSDYAYNKTRIMVWASYKRLSQRSVPLIVPDPVLVTTDEAGGVRIAWEVREKRLRAHFGSKAESRSYLYFQSNEKHDIEELDETNLSRRLAWLTQG